MKVLTLPDRRVLRLDGNAISSEDALWIAQKLFDVFSVQGPRISRHLMYEVKPSMFAECPHTTSIEEAIEMSKRENELEKKYSSLKR